ncbi:MAG: PIN domain-containing protein [Candidatus Altiarchaeia archaeon]
MDSEDPGYLPAMSLEGGVEDVVVDSNVLFTFFFKNSVAKKILPRRVFEFYSPVYALEEINFHREEILKKTRISVDSFAKLREELALFVEFIPSDEYSSFWKAASFIPDKDDIDFVALALKMGCPLWSNDKELKKQSLVEILTTDEFIKKYLYGSYPDI